MAIAICQHVNWKKPVRASLAKLRDSAYCNTHSLSVMTRAISDLLFIKQTQNQIADFVNNLRLHRQFALQGENNGKEEA
ncbi:MAG: hypothetical protein K8R90_05365 [Candidatus Cloacimonetes bacterium]|nr:hypothetical protein [Candidatus Cloacimonadota bacterium]